jgi:hypothetical protein
MKAELAAMLDAPDALARMEALPSFDAPAWARAPTDASLARWVLASSPA